MNYYHRDVSVNRQQRLLRRFKGFALVLACLVMAVLSAIVYDTLNNKREQPSQLGKPSVTVINSSLKEFGNDFFTFTAATNWQEVPEESSSNKYVFRSFRGSLVEQELIIYVNAQDKNLVATRLLPVRIEANKRLVLGDISEPCGKFTNTKNIAEAVIEKTTMLCQSDGTNFVVVVAERGADTSLELEHNGEKASYSFIYRNSTIMPDPSQLFDILNSFSSL